MKIFKRILLGLLVVFVVSQFFRPAKNLAAAPGPADLVVKYAPPPEVSRLLAVACYDCHSNHTRYPWYAEIQPVGWWLADHVNDAKAAVNFSEFSTMTAKDQSLCLDNSVDEINHDNMPLPSYRITHSDARLTVPEKALLTAWFQALSEKISAEAQPAEPAPKTP